MNLTETTGLSSANFPIAELQDYLRLGSGFTDDGVQDGVLETCLRAAMGAIEARTSKVLITRVFKWTFYRVRLEGGGMILPISPVTWILSFDITTRGGDASVYSRDDFVLQNDSQRMRIMPKSGTMPKIPEGGIGTMTVNAGYGTWSKVPPALQQAMLMLAASYYENRDAMLNGGGQMPLAVATLVAPFQRIRLRAGA